ncbi:TPA: SoxR reducing system protein RseC, partial [Salmonella enterica subsp. enterica serovar Enteritidis]
KLAARDAWQPVILNVALPPDLVRVETTSIETRQ